MSSIQLNPIGHVVSLVTDKVDENWGKVIARIELLKEYSGGLIGLENFSHIIVITFLNEAKFENAKHLKRRPRGIASMPELGIFSQRAKDRPNPIGVTAVEIIKVGSDFLEVKGLDAIHKTPVLDIKPYFPQFDRIENPIVPEWVNILMQGYF